MSEVMVVERPKWIAHRTLWRDDPQGAVIQLYKCYTYKSFKDVADDDYVIKVRVESNIEPITRSDSYQDSLRPIHSKAAKLSKHGLVALKDFQIEENSLVYVFEETAMAKVYDWMQLTDPNCDLDWYLRHVCNFIDSKGLGKELAEYLKSK
jgi:hypothetical protein